MTRDQDGSKSSPHARALLVGPIGIAILALLAFPAVSLASGNRGAQRRLPAAPKHQLLTYGAAGHKHGPPSRHAAPKVHDEIVGGSTAPSATFPWLAFVQDSVGSGYTLCSGTVVSPNVILTAGHCAEDTTTGALNPAGGYRVVTGTLDWSDASTRQVSDVSQVIVYPGFNAATGQGDAALLVLSTPTTAPPIPLAPPGDIGLLTPGTIGAIAGWGETVGGDEASTPTALQWATTGVQSAAYRPRQSINF